MEQSDLALMLTTVVGAILSLLFQYVPGLNDWYNGQSSVMKQIIMGAALAIVAAAMFGLACTPLREMLGIPATCTQVGIFDLIFAWLIAVGANQGIYKLTKRPARG